MNTSSTAPRVSPTETFTTKHFRTMTHPQRDEAAVEVFKAVATVMAGGATKGTALARVAEQTNTEAEVTRVLFERSFMVMTSAERLAFCKKF